MAYSTQRTRKVQWRLYEKFCVQYRLVMLPATSDTICLFIAYMAELNFQYSSVLNYVHSLTPLHYNHDVPKPPIDHFAVAQALAGYKRSCQDKPNKKLPILIAHLLLIKNKIEKIPQRVRVTFWSACLTAFFTLLRRSNLFFAKSNTYLKVKSVVKEKELFYLAATQIKTNRFEPVAVNLPLPLIPNSPLCPTAALIRQLALIHNYPEAPLFSYAGKSGNAKPLTAAKFTKYLRLILSLSDYDSPRYSVHSFRRGGATYAASIEVPAVCLKAQGQWRSSCYLQYVQREDAQRNQFANMMSASLQHTSYNA